MRGCMLTSNKQPQQTGRAGRLIRSHTPPPATPLAKQTLFCSITWYMQIKGCRVKHEVSDKLSVVFDLQGTWFAICVAESRGTPKTDGYIPWMLPVRVGDLSPGRNKATGAGTRVRATVGSGDLQLYQPGEAATSPPHTKLQLVRKKITFRQLLYEPECLVPILFLHEACRQISSLSSQVDSGYSHKAQ